jgi:hypothetical protein
MGLDMYLHAKRYIAAWQENGDDKIAAEIQKLFPELDGKHDDFGENISVIKGVTAQIGYWRKANAIHNWFVDNVQEGEDNCRPYYVSLEQLEELKHVCETVLADPARAEELLPTANGFFFGSTDYNEYYIDDLKHTIDVINECLKLPKSWDFEYYSSW